MDPSLVYHVEAGITIHDLYTNLDSFVDPGTGQPRPLGLLTMGGASGQTLAGAFSTGTHGGDYLMPPLADGVLAIHLIGAGGIQYWIEPSSGITDPSRLHSILPDVSIHNIIYDDDTFDACLVSMGCMGIIYAVALKVRDQYNLIETTSETTWQAFLGNVASQLSDSSHRFLQVALDPYTNSDGMNTCLVTTRAEGGDGTCNCTQGDFTGAIVGLIGDLTVANPIEAATFLAQNLQTVTELITGNAPPSAIQQALVLLVNNILSQAPDLRSVLANDYGKIMTAVWPPGTCGGKSFCVMDSSSSTARAEHSAARASCHPCLFH